MTILVTGYSGFLGSILIKYLETLGHNVKLFGNRGVSGEIKRIDLLSNFSYYPSEDIDIVVHVAGKVDVSPPLKYYEFYNSNLNATINLCQAIDRYGKYPKAFIFISSVSVYGRTSGELIDESHPLLCNTAYPHSKALSELFLSNWASKLDMYLSILRLPLIAGPDPKGSLGTLIESISKGWYFRVGSGEIRKSMVWGEDVAKLIPKLIETTGIFNLTDGCHPKVAEVDSIIAERLGKKIRRIPYWGINIIAKVGDISFVSLPINSEKLQRLTSFLTFDDSKAKKLLGWSPSPVLEKLGQIC